VADSYAREQAAGHAFGRNTTGMPSDVPALPAIGRWDSELVSTDRVLVSLDLIAKILILIRR
jgi:hypothetical protein